ncbi:MAG TPA: oxygenase MpaB family protein [Actinomycetota bacterium]|nr:oxygenase MpaB family protein [Actinomycetota bacterium]
MSARPGAASGRVRARGLGALLGLGIPLPGPGEPGDPGLFGPGSETWRVGRERVLLLGGQAALLLQLAHPLVAAGVAEHSDFRRRPLERLRATLRATLAVTFGDRRQAEEAARAVADTHRRVRGSLREAAGPFPAGTPYRALDPHLALWVHATLVEVALDTYERFVGPLGEARRARYFEEGKRFAALFGVTEQVMPRTYGEFRRYVGSMVEGPALTVTEEARALARDVLRPRGSPALVAVAAAGRLAAAGLLPARLREAFGLPWGAAERAAFASLARSVRAALPLLPARLRYWPHYLEALRRTGRA